MSSHSQPSSLQQPAVAANEATASSNPFFSDSEVKKGPAVNSLEDAPPDEPVPGSRPRDYTDDLRYQDVEDRTANRKLRQRFAEKAYKVAKWGLYGWGCVLILSVIGNVVGVKTFSDEVLIAITSATTLNLFAAFLGVIRGLFPSGKETKENGG